MGQNYGQSAPPRALFSPHETAENEEKLHKQQLAIETKPKQSITLMKKIEA